MDRWYDEQYQASAYESCAGLAQRWMHASLERGYSKSVVFPTTLELGGNVGEHLPFVAHSFTRYIVSDIAEREASSIDKTGMQGVSFLRADAASIPLEDGSVDRVLHTCLLHHVKDPEAVLLEVRRLLRDGGTADLFLPSDPGILFRLARSLGPVREARRKGLGEVKRLVDARDHRNHVGSLRRLITHHFRRDRVVIRSYPLPRSTWNSSLWYAYRVVRADRD